MNKEQSRGLCQDHQTNALILLGLVLMLYILSFDCCAALAVTDTFAELKTLTAETQKIVKNGCYIVGSASALVGTIWAVASQKFKVAESGFFSGSLLI